MKVIFSYLEFDSQDFCNIDMAKLTNSYAQQQGYKTCLYTDENGYKKLTPYINYDEVILFDKEITSQFTPSIWSMGKILAMSMVQEPFMHIDFDLFLLKSLPSDFISKDFFSLYPEPWLFRIPSYEESILEVYKLYPNPKELDFTDFYSYNFAVVGGQKFKEINFVCNRLIDFSISHGEVLQKFLYKKNFEENVSKQLFSHSWSLAVIFEQILIKNLMSTIFNIKISTLADKNILLYFKYHQNMGTEKELEYNLECKQILKKMMVYHKLIHLHGQKEEKFKYLKKKSIIKSTSS
jgi:hypothetical protein